jgi:TRAP-type C4-dicarboxylate transport system permease small subunit
MLQKIETILTRIILGICAIQGMVLVALMGIEVFFRYVIGRALSWPEEVAGIVFVWFTLLGIAVVMKDDSHISFDFILKRLPKTAAKSIAVFSFLIIMAYALAMIYAGFTYSKMFSFETTPAANISLWWVNISVPFSGGLLFLYALIKIMEIVNPSVEAKTP